MRLIDADSFKNDWNGGSPIGIAMQKVIDERPTIDPESLPIVRELRAEIEGITTDGKQDLWAVERKRREEAEEKLKQVKAERDSAVSDIEMALAHGPGYNICMLCKKAKGSISCKSTLCLPEWRGPVAENEMPGNGGKDNG